MKAHMNSQNNETSRHTPTLVISVIFADNRWRFCFLKEIVFHLLRRCCQSGSIFYYLDPHLGPAWVHPLRHPGAVSSSAASPAPLAMVKADSWARHSRFSSVLSLPPATHSFLSDSRLSHPHSCTSKNSMLQ